MRTGNLSRARRPLGSRGGLPIWAFVFVLAVTVVVAGWVALQSSPLNDGAVVARATAATEVKPVPASSPVQVQVADAQPSEAQAAQALPPPVNAPPVSDAEPAGTPVHTGSNPASPPAPVVEAAAEEIKPTPARTIVAAVAPTAVAETADDLVNLNTASLDELNALRGGGRIGKAIVRGRPYASVEDLVKKRILSRSAYTRIKDQVAVR